MSVYKNLRYALPVFCFASYYLFPGARLFLGTGLQFLQSGDFAGLQTWLLSYGVLAPMASIGIMIVQSVIPFLPGVLLTLANAWLFGWFQGALYTSLGALAGAVVDFYIARWYAKPVVDQLVKERRYTVALNAFIARYGAVAVFITRLVPLVPFKIVSYSAGLSAMSGRVFSAVTAVGQLPAILLYSALGEHLLANMYALLSVTLLLTGVAAMVYKYRDAIMCVVDKLHK